MASSTYGDAIARVRYLLRSYTGNHEVSTHLTASMTSSDLTATVADGDAVSSGLVEVDDELIWVTSASGGTITIPPYGRGYTTSTAASHASGAQVITDPAFPRTSISQAIIDTQRAIYPTVFAVKTVEIVWLASVGSYSLPADCDRVLAVSYQELGPSRHWQSMDRYTVDTNANTTAFSTGRAIHFREGAPVSQTVRIVYAGAFTEFASTADTLTGAGHVLSHFDLLVYGAAARLIQFVEVSRLELGSVENQERGKYSAGGAASALTRQLVALYDRRLAEESKRLRDLHPVRITFKTR